MDSEAYMYGLAVLPEFHGKGYGGKVLRNMVKKEQDAGYSILLEVETKNDNTLRLYESNASCQFKAKIIICGMAINIH